MNRIDQLFAEARRTDKRVFMPFLTAGDPDLPTTAAIAERLMADAETQGVPIIFEIGFPYSDPIADGATIQASYTRALQRGVKIKDILRTVQELRPSPNRALVAMVSYSLVYRNGGPAFLDQARNAGFDGAIIPDLPVEEVGALHEYGRRNDFKIIPLIAPTTPLDRAARIASQASGFVYMISVTGITGERDQLPPEIAGRIADLRTKTDLPICVGFGISNPEHVRLIGSLADGVIVGSALVRRLPDVHATRPESVEAFATFAGSLMAPLA